MLQAINILIASFAFIQTVISQDNLIKLPGFETPVLDSSDIVHSSFYKRRLYLDPSWYSKNSNNDELKILTLDTSNLNQLMDINFVSQSKLACQSI